MGENFPVYWRLFYNHSGAQTLFAKHAHAVKALV